MVFGYKSAEVVINPHILRKFQLPYITDLCVPGNYHMMVAAENASYIVAKEATGLAGAMLTLLRDPQLRGRVGTANRAKAVREYDQEAMFATYAALYGGDQATLSA